MRCIHDSMTVAVISSSKKDMIHLKTECNRLQIHHDLRDSQSMTYRVKRKEYKEQILLQRICSTQYFTTNKYFRRSSLGYAD
jgi:hypothetical protein